MVELFKTSLISLFSPVIKIKHDFGDNDRLTEYSNTSYHRSDIFWVIHFLFLGKNANILSYLDLQDDCLLDQEFDKDLNQERNTHKPKLCKNFKNVSKLNSGD